MARDYAELRKEEEAMLEEKLDKPDIVDYLSISLIGLLGFTLVYAIAASLLTIGGRFL